MLHKLDVSALLKYPKKKTMVGFEKVDLETSTCNSCFEEIVGFHCSSCSNDINPLPGCCKIPMWGAELVSGILHISPRTSSEVIAASEMNPLKHVAKQEGFESQQEGSGAQKREHYHDHVTHCLWEKLRYPYHVRIGSVWQLNAFAFSKPLDSLFSWKD